MSPFDFKQHLTELLVDALKTVAPEAADISFVVERPKDARHGDYATNLAMQLARPLRQNPRALAEKLITELPLSEWVDKAEIAGAGFINFTLTHAARQRIVADFARRHLIATRIRDRILGPRRRPDRHILRRPRENRRAPRQRKRQ